MHQIYKTPLAKRTLAVGAHWRHRRIEDLEADRAFEGAVALAHATHHGWRTVKKKDRRSYRRVSTHLRRRLLGLLLMPACVYLLPVVVASLAVDTSKAQSALDLLARLRLLGLPRRPLLPLEPKLCASEPSTCVLFLSSSRRRRLPMSPRRRRRGLSNLYRALARSNQTLD